MDHGLRRTSITYYIYFRISQYSLIAYCFRIVSIQRLHTFEWFNHTSFFFITSSYMCIYILHGNNTYMSFNASPSLDHPTMAQKRSVKYTIVVYSFLSMKLSITPSGVRGYSFNTTSSFSIKVFG